MPGAASPAFPPIPGPADRVHFLDEQRRNRRQSWRFSLFAFAGLLITGLPLCFLVTPFLFGGALLVAHLINLVAPLDASAWIALKAMAFSLPIVFAIVTHQVDKMPPATRDLIAQVAPFITDPHGNLTLPAVVFIVAMLVLPGALATLLGWLWLRMLFPTVGVAAALSRLHAREPNRNDFEEHQLANIVEEIAVAASVPPPRLMLVDTEAANAAAVGLPIHDATIVVTRGLLDRLNRDETQAIIAHVIASVGNGDLKIMSIIISLFQTWGLLTLVLSTPLGPRSRRALWRLIRFAVSPRRRNDPAEAEAIAELLIKGTDTDQDDFDALLAKKTTPINMLWHIPLVVSFGAGSFGGKVWVQVHAATFVGATITHLWRSRRLLADSTAVQLTRYPDALGRAVIHLAEIEVEPPNAANFSYLFAVWTPPTKRQGSRMTGLPLLMSMHPTLDRRLERLRALGASLDPSPYRSPRLGFGRAAMIFFVIPFGLLLVAAFFAAALLIMTVGFVVMMALLIAEWAILQFLFAALAGSRRT